MSISQPIAVKLDPGLRDRIKALATARDRSSHWVMREAIVEYVEREERRESVRRDARLAWDAYAMTGAHVTASEADAWLSRLEVGEDADPPEAHG